jgi:hypothetical protein
MNQVDLFIVAVVAAFAVSGARRGMISSAGDILTILLALGIGSIAYPLAAAPIGWAFSLPPSVSGPLGYLVVAVVVVLLAGWGWSALSGRFEPSKQVSRAGGGALRGRAGSGPGWGAGDGFWAAARRGEPGGEIGLRPQRDPGSAAVARGHGVLGPAFAQAGQSPG